MDREAWRAAVHGVLKSRTRLSDYTEREHAVYPRELYSMLCGEPKGKRKSEKGTIWATELNRTDHDIFSPIQ